MIGKNNKIKSFTDLIAWRKSHELTIFIYKVTKKFPKEEIFGITNQMRRCAVSIPSNIAEGFSGKFKKEKIQFYRISLGSLTELQSQILISRDVGFIDNKDFKKLTEMTIESNKLINGLIKSAEGF